MPFIRSAIFWFFFYISVALLVFLYFALKPFIRHASFADDCAKIWSQTILLLLRIIHGINYKIIGLDKIPKTPCIIACQHQSAWETIVFHLLCKYPAYIYKKELLNVPLYGWYVKYMTGIKVDRQGGAGALKNMIRQSKEVLKKGHNIIIFPQGTRVPVGSSVEKYPYQVGVAALYLACDVPVVPAALNSGQLWKKGALIRKSGTITLEFLDPIETGLKKDDFMKKLEDDIEKNGVKLLN